MQVIVIGAGGHGQVVADILWRMHAAGEAVEPVGFLDDADSWQGQWVSKLPVLGKTADLFRFAHDALVVAIGNNLTRQRVAQALQAQGEQFVTVCHPTAVIASDVSIGPGTMICANVVINPGAVIGSHAILNTACTVDHHNRIGDFAHIAPGAHLGGDVQVGEGSFIGIGGIVIPQKQVGNWCTVGAGAVVIRDVPDGVTAVGVPARIIKNNTHGN
ncbi:MAG: acetyltransferase [Anaerolineae bacterium]|nr:acetyltransferase [Anaerolineae bacterium]